MEKRNIKKITIIFRVIIFCLLALLVGRCCQYALRNQELQEKVGELTATLADRDKTIDAERADNENLREQLAEAVSMEEYRTETGFVKKNGVYLIDDRAQLQRLSQLVAQGAEIEPGVAAAEAFYRLRRDLEISDWLSMGTEEAPFSGRFDGDGHTISGKFPLSVEGEDVLEAFFLTDSTDWVKNLQIKNYMDQSFDRRVSQGVENQEDCTALAENLANFPNCSIRLTVYDGDFDTQEIADELRERWERNQEQDGYSVSVNFYSDLVERPQGETYTQNAMTPFGELAGAEYAKIIEEAVEQEEGYLTFIKLERIGELNCCTFEISGLEDRDPREGDSYHIILDGNRESKEVSLQHFIIPYTSYERQRLAVNNGYRVESVDVDFDGKEDLLIHEGGSGGSGGSWSNYRAIVWREEEGGFEYYPSFPEQVISLEFDRQRVIDRWRLGASYECVAVYGVVNGEYTCTRRLVSETVYDKDREEFVEMLSYYEMEELVQTHILSDYNEREELYPDMNYWLKG